MLGLGLGEIFFVLLVVLVVVGPDRLPQFMRTAGRLWGQLRRTADDFRRSLVLEADRQDAEARRKAAQERWRREREEREAAEARMGGVAQPPDLLVAPPEEGVDPASLHNDAVARGDGPPPADTALPEDGRVMTGPPLRDLPPADDEPPPPGVSAREWAELPPHLRDLLRAKLEGDPPPAPGGPR